MLRRALGLRNTGVRAFATSPVASSNIGKQPIELAEGTECYSETIPFEFSKRFTKGSQNISLTQQIIVKGPKGSTKTLIPDFVKVVTNNGLVTVSVPNPEEKIQRAMWGTTRALINNHVIGVSDGHIAIVKFVGTGYRASIEPSSSGNGKQQVSLKIGYPYQPTLEIPDGLTVTSPNPTRLLIEGVDKQAVKQFAAKIREHKKPEPYKGKGIYVDDETIKLKEKKIK